MHKYITTIFVPLVLVASTLPSTAATVYTQGVNSLGSSYASQNDVSVGGRGSFAKVYDNFSLTETTNITDVHWAGGFFNPPSPGLISSFLIQIWDDTAGAPGTQLFFESVNGAAGQVSDGSNAGGLLYSYNVDLANAFVAQAGTTYWLSVQPTMDVPPQWGWAGSTGGDGVSFQDFFGTRTLQNVDMAFRLTSTAISVPEPGSLLLAGLALVGLVFSRRVGSAG